MEAEVAGMSSTLLLPLTGGIVLGLFYFGGLWLTVRNLHLRQHPAGVSLVSFALRSSLTLAGFWLLMAGQPLRLLFCLAGFFTVRVILMQRLAGEAAAVSVRCHQEKADGDQP